MPRLKGRGPKRRHPAFPPAGGDRPRTVPAARPRGTGAVPTPDGTRSGAPTPTERITSIPGIFGGKPVIRGRRLAVEHVLGLLAAGESAEAVLASYPWLEGEEDNRKLDRLYTIRHAEMRLSVGGSAALTLGPGRV